MEEFAFEKAKLPSWQIAHLVTIMLGADYSPLVKGGK
jgi:hypothetical protein